MGSTHRVYELKEKEYALLEVAQDLWKIHDSLCLGQEKLFYHQFNVNNFRDLEEVQSRFEVQAKQMYSTFSIRNFSLLHEVFNRPSLFERISLSNHKVDFDKRDYLHYWISTSPSDFYVLIVLPITEDFGFIKAELKKILAFLVSKNTISLKDGELVDLANMLIDSNLKVDAGYTYNSNGVEFYAKGDFYPRGSDQIRPSAVKLTFDDSYFKSKGGMQHALTTLYDTINDYFSEEEYKIEGRINSKTEWNTYSDLSKLNFLEFNIPIFLDLNKNPNFTARDLLLHSKPNSSLIIKQFDWKNCESHFQDNRVCLWINNLNDWSLAIDIEKQIEEEYYFNIELLIDKELEYKGME